MTSFRAVRSQEKADAYIDQRFGVSGRMSRLDRLEQGFAAGLMQLVGPEGVVADIPCGNGRFVEVFSQARELLLIDYAPTMLEALQKRCPDLPNAKLLVGDITDLSLPDGSVDLAFCMRLFHHIEDGEMRRAALGELARISRRYVAFSFYSTSSWRYWRRRLLGKKPSGHAIPMKTMLAEAAACGLQFEWCYPRFQFVEQQRLLLFSKVDS